MPKDVISFRLSDKARKQISELRLKNQEYIDSYGGKEKNVTDIVEEAIDHLYTAKTSGKYQSQLFQSMQDFIVMVMDQNLKNFVSSLNQNLETNMMNYEMIKLVLYNASISTRPDVMQKVLSEYQDYEEFCKETVIEKVTKAEN